MDPWSGFLRAVFRGGVLVFFALVFLVHSRLGSRTRRRLCDLVARYSRLALRVLGIRLRVENPQATVRPTLIVCNHLSYVDIFVLSAVCRPAFVATADLLDIPFVGTVLGGSGTFFIERRADSNLPAVVDTLAGFLREGWPIVVFPEAGASDGSGVLPFKPAPFEAALRAEADVLALCLRYTAINGGPLTRRERDFVFWYGDMTFWDHLARFLTIRELTVEVECLSLRRQDLPRKLAAERARSAIAAAYRPPA